MGNLAQDSFLGVIGLKTALAKVRTVLSHGEAVKRENTQMLCQHGDCQPHGGGHNVPPPPQSFRQKLWALHKSSPHQAVGRTGNPSPGTLSIVFRVDIFFEYKANEL